MPWASSLAIPALAVLALSNCSRIGYSPRADIIARGDTLVDSSRGDLWVDGGRGGERVDGNVRDRASDLSSSCAAVASSNKSYVICPAAVSWDAAEQRCIARGMHLVKIESATEDAWVLQQGQLVVTTAGVWLGGTDRELEGTWRWWDGTTFYSGGLAKGYTHFGSGEPNNAGGSENCLEMRLGNGGGLKTGEWNDTACDKTSSFVCEGP